MIAHSRRESTQPSPSQAHWRTRRAATFRAPECVMPYASVAAMRLYYELTGDQSAPALLQVGGPMFGRHNFRNVNGIFARHFQLLSYDASGYGRSTSPLENYSIEAWADEAAGL